MRNQAPRELESCHGDDMSTAGSDAYGYGTFFVNGQPWSLLDTADADACGRFFWTYTSRLVRVMEPASELGVLRVQRYRKEGTPRLGGRYATYTPVLSLSGKPVEEEIARECLLPVAPGEMCEETGAADDSSETDHGQRPPKRAKSSTEARASAAPTKATATGMSVLLRFF